MCGACVWCCHSCLFFFFFFLFLLVLVYVMLLYSERIKEKDQKPLKAFIRETEALEDEIGCDPGGLPKIQGQSMEAVLAGVGVSKWSIVLMQKQEVDLMRVVTFEQEDWLNLGIDEELDQKRILEAYYLCKAADVDPCKYSRLRNIQDDDAIGAGKSSSISKTGKQQKLPPLVNPFKPIGPELPLFYDEQFREEMRMEARKHEYQKELAARAEEASKDNRDNSSSRSSSLTRIFKNGKGPEDFCDDEYLNDDEHKISSTYYMPPIKGGGGAKEYRPQIIPWTRWKWDSYYVKCREPFERLVRYKGRLRSFLREKLNPTDRILVIGCGLSELSHGLYKDGFFFITNIDFSEEAIRIMQDRSHNQFKKMSWQVLDVTDMHSIQNKSYDVVIDKGLMDSMLMVYRVLKPGGTFFQFSAERPETRLSVLMGTIDKEDSKNNNHHRKMFHAKQNTNEAAAAAAAPPPRGYSGGGALYWTVTQDILPQSSKDQQLHAYDDQCSTLLPLQEITHTPFATRPIDLRTDEEIRKQPLGPENLPASTAFYK
eukprot:jgi/Bigna1/82895/fgenesh1_pg.99_\